MCNRHKRQLLGRRWMSKYRRGTKAAKARLKLKAWEVSQFWKKDIVECKPSFLWSLRIFPPLPGYRLMNFYRVTTTALLQLVNQWLNFTYTFLRFPLRKKADFSSNTNSGFHKNRTHDFRTSRCMWLPTI